MLQWPTVHHFGSIYFDMQCTKAYTYIILLKELAATHSTFFLEAIINLMHFSCNSKVKKGKVVPVLN
jgi:hypothetical protein